MKKTKHDIVIIGPAWPLRGGGMSTFNERLAKAFEQNGFSTQIVSFSLQYPAILFPGKSQFTDEPAPDNLNAIALINSINPISWLKTVKYITNQQPKIVVVRYWMPFMAPCLGFICRKLSKVGFTVIAITDNIIPHEKFPFQNQLTNYFLKGCQGFVSMSEAVLADLRLFEKNKPAIVVAHPLYDNFGAPPSREDACRDLNLNSSFNYILFFGFIRAYKGLDLLLKAFALSHFKALGLKLIIAGEFYDDQQKYTDLISHLNLTDWVVLHTHFIPNNAVANYFAAADLVAQTYWHATQSGVTQIAFFYNKPMLVTPVGGLAEMVQNGLSGYVCQQNETKIAEALNDFFENQRGDSFSKQVAIDKKRFSWDVFTNAILEIGKQAN